jgi:hypothetical protein
VLQARHRDVGATIEKTASRAVSPSGKLGNVVVATMAVPVKGNVIQQWICELFEGLSSTLRKTLLGLSDH